MPSHLALPQISGTSCCLLKELTSGLEQYVCQFCDALNSSNIDAQGLQSFNTQAITWGGLAKQMYSWGSTYQWVPLGLVLGFAAPLPGYFLHRLFPKVGFNYLNMSIICWHIGMSSSFAGLKVEANSLGRVVGDWNKLSNHQFPSCCFVEPMVSSKIQA